MNAKAAKSLRARLASGEQVLALRTNLQMEHQALAAATQK